MLHGTLFRLNFEKIRIANETKEAQNKLQSLYDYNDQDPILDGLLEQDEQDDNNIIVGVKFRIKNPDAKHQDQGVVRGSTSNGFAQIYTSDGSIIRRLPKHLRRVKRYQGQKFLDIFIQETEL